MNPPWDKMPGMFEPPASLIPSAQSLSPGDSDGAVPALPGQDAPLSVARLNRLVRQQLEARFPLLWVSGEISNLTVAASGHAYFSLKDEAAQVRCVMFRNRLQSVGWQPRNGDRVEARALVTLYEARGDFQLNVENLRRSGQGSLYQRFLELKDKLDRAGCFDPAGKQPLPGFPRRIGVITSPQAAALRDVLTTLARRSPQVQIIVYPTPVQGPEAIPGIVAALALANQRREVDTLILCRGGGSLEDLWAFNEEAVVQAVVASRLPVVTGVGHETDVTLVDFAADRRAPTPTAAAEMAAPEQAVLLHRLDAQRTRLQGLFRRMLETRALTLDNLARRLLHPGETLQRQQLAMRGSQSRLTRAWVGGLSQRRSRLEVLAVRLLGAAPKPDRIRRELDGLAQRLQASGQGTFQQHRQSLQRIAQALVHLDPSAVLNRGYALVRTPAGQVVTAASAVAPDDTLTVQLAQGSLAVKVVGDT